MARHLSIVKLLLLCFTAAGYYLTWHLFLNNGGVDMISDIQDNGPHILPFNGNAPLRKVYTGIDQIDDRLTVLALFFYNVVDGSHPHACLQAYHFAGQLIAGWGLLMVESLRHSNRGRMISL